MEIGKDAFRVSEAICPQRNLKLRKIIETKSLFEGSLTFHIIKFKCESCGREYLDLEQAEVYDLYLILNEKLAGIPLETVGESFAKMAGQLSG